MKEKKEKEKPSKERVMNKCKGLQMGLVSIFTASCCFYTYAASPKDKRKQTVMEQKEEGRKLSPGKELHFPDKSAMEPRERASMATVYFWSVKRHPVIFLMEEEVRRQQG